MISRNQVKRVIISGVLSCHLLGHVGCHVHSPEVTAVPLSPWNQNEPCGIPYYLPKPLLVVSKNVRHIEGTKVGLTDPAPIPNSFDHQSEYADLKANVSMPSSTGANTTTTTIQPNTNSTNAPQQVKEALAEVVTPNRDFDRELAQDSFFTYQIIFVPDLSQKYGLRIKGGAGEIRAAMNMVNGWMFTGLGPYYMKDSSTAQNRMASGVAAMYAGRGIADVTESLGDLITATNPGQNQSGGLDASELQKFAKALDTIRDKSTTQIVQDKTLNFAEIYIYEPSLTPDGCMQWNMIAHHNFERDFLRTEGGIPPDVLKGLLGTTKPIVSASDAPKDQAGLLEPAIRSKLLQFGNPTKQSGALGSTPGINVEVNVGDDKNVHRGNFSLFGNHRKTTPQIKSTTGSIISGTITPESLPIPQSRSSPSATPPNVDSVPPGNPTPGPGTEGGLPSQGLGLPPSELSPP